MTVKQLLSKKTSKETGKTFETFFIIKNNSK